MSWWLLNSSERLRRAYGLGLQAWADIAVGIAELAFARIALARLAGNLDQLLAMGASPPTGPSFKIKRRGVRIGRAIGRAAELAPWRTDCLVKALAAHHWLRREGIGSAVELGVRRGPPFSAHAWVRVGKQVIIGGEETSFVPLAKHDRATK